MKLWFDSAHYFQIETVLEQSFFPYKRPSSLFFKKIEESNQNTISKEGRNIISHSRMACLRHSEQRMGKKNENFEGVYSHFYAGNWSSIFKLACFYVAVDNTSHAARRHCRIWIYDPLRFLSLGLWIQAISPREFSIFLEFSNLSSLLPIFYYSSPPFFHFISRLNAP